MWTICQPFYVQKGLKFVLKGSQLAKLKKCIPYMSPLATVTFIIVYRVQAVGLKSSNNILEINILVKMWNLGQFFKKIDIGDN